MASEGAADEHMSWVVTASGAEALTARFDWAHRRQRPLPEWILWRTDPVGGRAIGTCLKA